MENRGVQDGVINSRQLIILEKYEDFLNYVYPISQNFPRAQNALKDRFLDACFVQAELFIQAGKTSQISKLYNADAGLASLRFYLRFMVHPSRKLITNQQHRVASVHLAETGCMLGAWIKTTSRKGE